MIEREFVKDKIRGLKIKELIEHEINKYAGIGDISVEKTPLGEKIVVYAVRPGLVIGSGGESVKRLTYTLKHKFKLDNPQIEIKEITDPNSWAAVVAKMIASDFERFGPRRYKASGYRALSNIIRSGARGAEIRITGVGIPGERARTWRFFAGYLKKSGDTAVTIIDKAYASANLRRGTIGIKVLIMPAGAVLPDDVTIKFEETVATEVEIKKVESVAEVAAAKKDDKPIKSEPKKEVKVKAKTESKADKPVAKPVKKTAAKPKAAPKTAKKPAKKSKETKVAKIKTVKKEKTAKAVKPVKKTVTKTKGKK
jgi:small subunit ribosomal protein S3